MKHKIAIQMDDIKTIDYDYDSSFMIGLEGQKRNYELFVYHPNDLFLDSGILKANGFFIELIDQDKDYFKFISAELIARKGNDKYVCWIINH